MRPIVPGILLLLATSACAEPPPPAPSDAGAAPDAPWVADAGAVADDAAADHDAAPEPSVDRATVTFGPEPLAEGAERTVCIVVDAGNEVPRQVSAIRTLLPVGSHHMIVYRTGEPLDPTPNRCTPFADGGDAIFIAETREAELLFPADAALAFDAHQHIRLEVHMVNYVGMPLDVSASATFDFLPLGTPERAEVHLLFTGELSLVLPPHERTTFTSYHVPDEGARIIALTSHTHSLGVLATIEDADVRDRVPPRLLHESTSWAEPPLDSFAPPLVLAPDHGLRLTCVFENTRDETVTFGLDFDEEMCFLWAYWY